MSVRTRVIRPKTPGLKSVQCPALVVAAPSSHSGKTTVVAAIARYFTNQGKKVRVFKTGPDFIDPHFLAVASGYPVYQLDFWMCGESHCKQLVAQAAQEADLILIEGVMGMFDGQCSSADIAVALGIPVMAVIDAGAMAQTFGAIASGLAHFRPEVEMYGVFANRVGSSGHAEMLKESLPESLTFCGYLPKDSHLILPERHLGLVQAQELDDLETRLNLAADLITQNGEFTLPPCVPFSVPPESPYISSLFDLSLLTSSSHPPPLFTSLLQGTTIAIAQDTAFSFIYPANIDVLVEMGAILVYFSPIQGDSLPDCDAVYLPGGYPELFMEALTSNGQLQQQLRTHVAQDKPLLAECGGMLYLNRTLKTETECVNMSGVLDADSVMQPSLAALGLVTGELRRNDWMRGHTFHYSTTVSNEGILCVPVSQRGKKLDPVWKHRQTIASYIHWYFPSNPTLTAKIFRGER